MKHYEESEDFLWDKIQALEEALKLVIKTLNQIPDHPLSGEYSSTYQLIPHLEKVLEGI